MNELYFTTTSPFGYSSFPKEENWVTASFGSVVFQIILYGFKYAPGAFEHCPVLKSEHVYSFLFSQESRTSLVIIRTGIMHFSIQFDCQLDFRAIEVYNIGSDALLPSEFQAIQLFAFQHPPKDGFGGCGMVPQGLPIFFVFFFVHQGLHKRYRFARLVLIVCHKVICRYHPARWALTPFVLPRFRGRATSPEEGSWVTASFGRCFDSGFAFAQHDRGGGGISILLLRGGGVPVRGRW